MSASLRPEGGLAADPWLSLWHPECVLDELAEVPGAAGYVDREQALEAVGLPE